MPDNVLQYAVQLGTITAAALAFAEFGTPKIVRKYFTTRPKMITALVYALVGNTLGWVAGLVALPGERLYQNIAGLLVLSAVSMGMASGIVSAKKKFIDGRKKT